LIQLTATGHNDQAHEDVIDRVSTVIGLAGDSYEPLMPIHITFDNDSSPDFTALHVSSIVTPGFLFAFTNALAMLQIDIQHAQIITAGTQVEDTFWIRDAHGHKIESLAKLQQLRTASVLIKQFAYLLPLSANPNQALRQFRDMVKYMLRSAEQSDINELHSSDAMRTLAQMMGVSRHLWEDFLRMQHENLFPLVSDPSRLIHRRTRKELHTSLTSALQACQDDEDKAACLNGFKDREIFRTDLRHITGRIGYTAFTREISNIAEVVTAQAVSLCRERLQSQHGRPTLDNGSPCRWSVLALGKCGAREMGFASDIELMFVYEGPGQTSGPQQISNQKFFIELVCLLLKLIKAPKEGIFEIDLRLRPYGKDGVLASSKEAFKKYYGFTGPARQFERMALVKLRPIAGDQALGNELLKIRNAYVYADQPLDYENIAHLRRRQAKELVPSGTINAKYSAGGLVDLEYYVQANQIERGSTQDTLRVTNTLEALTGLQEAGHIDSVLADHIQKHYQLIRRIIDGLRIVRGHAKDLSIPAPQSRAFTYLARRLGYTHTKYLQRDIYNAMALGWTLWKKHAQGKDWTTIIEHTLLVCTDTHARMLLPDIDHPGALAWLHGGDFYLRKNEPRRKRPMGPEALKGYSAKKTDLQQWLTRHAIPVYTVRGNHDISDPWGFFQSCRDISGHLEEIIPGLFVAGIGWSGQQFYDLPDEAKLASVCEGLTEQILNQLPADAALIVLSHYPAVTELCPGFACINDLLARFKPTAIMQGHIHEAFEQQTILTWDDGTQTLVFNPGPWGGVLTIQPEAGTATFKPASNI
jgi:glutamate-ammonia-ligase adenylyltransferase